MRRSSGIGSVIAAAALLAGCGPEVDGEARATSVRSQPPAAAATDDDDLGAPIVPTSDPDRTRRAREIYLIGVKLLAAQRVDEAIREFQQALEIDPLFYKSHFKLGISYYHKGQYPLEISEYKKCLAIQPSYVPAWTNLGHAYLARDELELARDAYERVLELEPRHAIALYNKALVEFDLRNEKESERLFRHFLQCEDEGEMANRARQYLQEIERRQGRTASDAEKP